MRLYPSSNYRWGLLAAGLLCAASARAQDRRPVPAAPAKPSAARSTSAPLRTDAIPDAPSDEQSYEKEFVFGVNFNTQGGLLGGASIRSSRVMDDRRLRFWSLEGVMLKNAKEQQVPSDVGGMYTKRKTNYAFVLRPSFGLQRILFRKAADAGVQVNGLLSVGPSFGLLMPYYISYDRTVAQRKTVPNLPNLASDEIVNEQYDPYKHGVTEAILDRGPLFSGIGQTQVVPGVHLRGALSFEYGRYRDAVAGLEAGFLVESFTKRMLILSPSTLADTDDLNRKFFPSVYLTLYFGHRS